MKQSARNKLYRCWDRKFLWNSFFSYRKSVLACRYPIKLYPTHAQDDVMRRAKFDQIRNYVSKPFGKLSTPVSNSNACSLATRIP
jgi:hypothetical protein